MTPHIKTRLSTLTLLTACAAAIGATMALSKSLTDSIRRESEDIVRAVRDAQRLIQQTDDANALEYATSVLRRNTQVPMVLCDGDTIISYCNIAEDRPEATEQEVTAAARAMMAEGDTMNVDLGDGRRQTLYYGENKLLASVAYVRWMEATVVTLMVALMWMLLTSSRRRERDSLWKGLALETAHQLGTPISALDAWRDLLESGAADNAMVAKEMGKDLDRLKAVSERFSKIGSQPAMTTAPINDSLRQVAEYMNRRTSKKICIELHEPAGDVTAPHDPTLLRWAVENVCKNAADAIDGSGRIDINVGQKDGRAVIDIADTGKGMTPATRRHVFDAGFTTKKRGWGIGLALVKRIVEEYHHGRVWVAESRPGVGTRFRITLPLTPRP